MPLGNLALDAARDALTRVLGGACGGGGGRVEPGGDGGLVGGWWWWWCAAVVHVRVDAGVEGVGGAGGVRAVGAFGGGLLHCGCGGIVVCVFGYLVWLSGEWVGDIVLLMMLHLLSSGAGGASLCGSAVDVIGSSGADLLNWRHHNPVSPVMSTRPRTGNLMGFT